ncbi:MAG: hypothetical protein NC922_08210 [Candidatus Omnitrophica bacterium]|nr:hypothetical protein [Candidatus Omnitrophota bacterium]
MSNLKQIGVAFLMYAQDYDEYLIPLYSGDSNSSYNWWPAIAVNYLVKRSGGASGGYAMEKYQGKLNCPNLYRKGYYWMTGYALADTYISPRKLSKIKNQHLKGMIADSPWDGNRWAWVFYPYLTPITYESTSTSHRNRIVLRHNNLANLLYVDGHVEQLDMNKWKSMLGPGTWSDIYKTYWDAYF